jgi:hypothetical protein
VQNNKEEEPERREIIITFNDVADDESFSCTCERARELGRKGTRYLDNGKEVARIANEWH